MSLAEKFMAGADLFEEACRWAMMEIRIQFPDFNAEEQQTELRRRLKMI